MRRSHVEDDIYLDEAEGFLLEHSLFSPPRSWRPLPPEPSQVDRLAHGKRKMDWSAVADGAGPSSAGGVPEGSSRRRASAGAAVRGAGGVEHEGEGERCVICLMGLRDRTIVGGCGHEFCFECIGVWSNQSRRCPLCSADMAPFLLHDLDNSSPTKFYLPPLPQRKLPSMSLPRLPGAARLPRLDTPGEDGADAEKREMDELDLQVERRREIYRFGLYAKHIASNTLTSFRPNPTPRELADSPGLVQRAAAFMRRELRVWDLADVEFLTNHILSLIKAIDIRSEPAIRLLSELLDHQAQSSTSGAQTFPHAAEHFAHELYSFLRSPYKELWKYDEVAQYDPLPSEEKRSSSPGPDKAEVIEQGKETSPPPLSRSSSRSLRSLSRSRSRSRSYSRSSSFSSLSRSPSPRSPRRWDERDTYVSPPSATERRWDQPDTWLDPEYAAWLEDEQKRARERDLRRRARRATLDRARVQGAAVGAGPGMRTWGPLKAGVELLPSPEKEREGVMVVDVLEHGSEKRSDEVSKRPGLSIRGSAEDAAARRLSLHQRLAMVKAEAKAWIFAADPSSVDARPPSPPEPDPASLLPPAAATALALKSPGVRTIVLARLRLRLKLAAERRALTHNTNETRAQELRRVILERRAARTAREQDAALRELDREDRKRELRRRLAVEMMRLAETEGERRERELRDKVAGAKRARVLKEALKARRAGLGVGKGAVEGEVQKGVEVAA